MFYHAPQEPSFSPSKPNKKESFFLGGRLAPLILEKLKST
jgi:hypothetical protein